MDTTIRVDRSISPVYPDWVKSVIHPELETVGPAEYDLTKIDLYLHNLQKNEGSITGQQLYNHLKEIGNLKNCLGIQDAAEIQKKDLPVYYEVFGHKSLCFWRSVVSDQKGNIRVLCLQPGGRRIGGGWYWLHNNYSNHYYTAQFAS